MESLNRAFEKAFAHTATKDTLMDLLECIGEEFTCDRISIFELNEDGSFDNTYEWCRQEVTHVRELMQNIAPETFDSWIDRVKRQEYLLVRDLESVRQNDPDIYRLLHSQRVHTVVAARLAFHGRDIGFFILENPSDSVLEDTSTIMPGMRYIISSLVYSDHLIRKLEKIGYRDHLTGAGNRMGLMEQLEQLDPDCSLGVLYCEVLGWEDSDHRTSSIRHEQALIRVGEILRGIFESDRVFRVADGEFLVLEDAVDHESFEDSITLLHNLFIEHELLVAVGSFWKESGAAGTNYDAMIRNAHMAAHSSVANLDQHRQSEHATPRMPEHEAEMANITMFREDQFFKEAGAFLENIFDEAVLTAVIDINYFKLYNDIFGRRAGNLLLESIADQLLDVAEKQDGIAGYLGGDNFCLVFPVKETEQEALRPMIENIISELKYPDGFAPALGVYLSTDKQESLVAMYDHALTALQEIKGSYMEHYRFYDEDHFRRDRNNKLLLMEVKEGLKTDEFMFFLQPQVNERTGKIVGAEALVRWRNKGQLVMPGQFIPALEKSGYIFAVDCYVWEAVVKWISGLEKRGLPVLPVSVNVSRVDFYFTDIAQHFINLVERYGLDPALLGIEITESAFTDNTDSILAAVSRLHEYGFRVLMDDFGSGSSSLSMLHSMSLDVLKTDVRFMSKEEHDGKAISIVESVVSMAHIIGMIVVTEGVETQQQRDSLVAIGDNYAQGFYFYRPMPVSDFESLLQDKENIGIPLHLVEKKVETHLKFREMIKDGMLSETLLDNIIGPAVVFKEERGIFSVVQSNDQYLALFGYDGGEDPDRDPYLNSLENLQEIIGQADRHPIAGAEGAVSLSGSGEEQLTLDAKIFLLYSYGTHRLYFATFSEQEAFPERT